jgi:hypothetical protein
MFKKTILAALGVVGLAFTVSAFTPSTEAAPMCGPWPCHHGGGGGHGGGGWHGGGFHHGFGGFHHGFGGFPGPGFGGYPGYWAGPPDTEVVCHWRRVWRHHHRIRVRVCERIYW